jgi:ribosomal protein S27AE
MTTLTPVEPTAVLCIDCGKVSETRNECRKCGSSAVLNLARLLDRAETEKRRDAAI